MSLSPNISNGNCALFFKAFSENSSLLEGFF